MEIKYLLIILITAVTGFVMMVVVGCGQGAANAPSGSTDPTTSPGTLGEQATTAEQTTYVEMHGLQCRSGKMNAAIFDYAVGAKGEKASPVELAQGDFSKSIEEGDTVEIADRPEAPMRGQCAWSETGGWWPSSNTVASEEVGS